jgi:hypothetical protein
MVRDSNLGMARSRGEVDNSKAALLLRGRSLRKVAAVAVVTRKRLVIATVVR